MTLRHGERISGCEILPGGAGPGAQRTFHAYENGVLVATATESGEKRALEVLVNRVYAIRSEQVRAEQGRRCFAAGCGRLAPLEIDHVKPRGSIHGRDDRRVNLRALCTDCHGLRHHPLHPVEPRPHPRIVELMAAVGLRWAGDCWERIETCLPTTSAPSESASSLS